MDTEVLNDEIDLLSALPFFANFNRDALKLLAFSADTRILRENDILFHKNDLADSGFLILSGSVHLHNIDHSLPGPMLFGRGTLLGQSALLAKVRRPSSATMKEAGAVLKITRILMKRVLNTYPAIAVSLRQRLNDDVEVIVGEVQIAIKNAARAFGEA